MNTPRSLPMQSLPAKPIKPIGNHPEDDHDFEEDENAAFLTSEEATDHGPGVPRHIVRRLYTSHFLSTWNSRVFEFGAVLYLTSIFPGTLLPMSIYAFVRGMAAVLLAPAMGQYIDRSDRLQVVRVSIVLQRLVVAGSCAIFYLLLRNTSLGLGGKQGLFALVALLACVEKLCSILNEVSIEKDWVVVIAEKDDAALRTINSQMRRIDLMCKLLGPLCIALIDATSTETAILVNFTMNITSVVIEYFAIAWVYWEVPALREPKSPLPTIQTSSDQHVDSMSTHIWRVLSKTIADHSLYFHHTAFWASFGGALLYLTALSFGGQMVAFLLATGFKSNEIALARTVSVVFEVAATWVAPWLMDQIGPIRAGSWHSSWQVLTLLLGTGIFWTLFDSRPAVSASGLVIGTIFSRVGLRGFDLCVQVVVQNQVEAENRGVFSSVEAAWQNLFELLSFASTMIYFRPEDFGTPAVISTIALCAASACYAVFVRRERGHLVHCEKLFCGTGPKQADQECTEAFTLEETV